jgi:hypothetical protein
MDSLKYCKSPPHPIIVSPVGRPCLKQPYGCFRVGLPTGKATCGCLLPPWTPHAVHLCRGDRAKKKTVTVEMSDRIDRAKSGRGGTINRSW